MGRDVLTGRAGPLRQMEDDEEAYGKAGPLWEAPYGKGRSLREGPVLTGIQNWPGISACVP